MKTIRRYAQIGMDIQGTHLVVSHRGTLPPVTESAFPGDPKHSARHEDTKTRRHRAPGVSKLWKVLVLRDLGWACGKRQRGGCCCFMCFLSFFCCFCTPLLGDKHAQKEPRRVITSALTEALSVVCREMLEEFEGAPTPLHVPSVLGGSQRSCGLFSA